MCLLIHPSASYCAVNVHKNCKTLLPECASNKPKKDSFHKSLASSQVSLCDQKASLKDHPRFSIVGLEGTHAQTRGFGMTVTHKGNSRFEIQTTSGNRTSGPAAEMDELDTGLTKMRIFLDDTVSLASTADSMFLEDSFYPVRTELEGDALEFEAESWSSAVETPYAKKQKKEVIKRQDVIYELMQTEMHHVRTLKIMLKVYSQALREDLQYGNKDIHKLFPGVDDLLELHGQFLARFKERRKESLEEGSDRNYIIQKVGDILAQQFSGDLGERMKIQYGIFCSEHNKAVSHYKDLLRESKKFQNLMKKIGNSSIVRRLGIPECILLVTQRITKYPVLVERIIQNTEDGTEDFETLTRALTLIKESISDVDSQVHESEKRLRLLEIAGKMELKSSGKLKNGMTFRRENMMRRHLLHDGILYWKSASGRLKDILAVLMTDVLLLLQEKDQRYSFSNVDSKPPVILLQKLIVREVANEEKAMFLISASLQGPEMYEIHTTSKEERNSWMTRIRGAVESCPTEGDIVIDNEEDKKHYIEREAKVKELQERLHAKDLGITQSLKEKLQILTEMSDIYGSEESSQSARTRLLLGNDNGGNLVGEGLLRSAISEAEKILDLLDDLPTILSPQEEENTGSSSLPRRSETFGGYDRNTSHSNKTGSLKQKIVDRRTASSYSEIPVEELEQSESDMSRLDDNGSSTITQDSELISKVKTLLQMLYSLMNVITMQDSYVEVQRERERQFRQQSSRGNWILEQEKQRNFEKQREEFSNVQKLQEQLKSNRQRWEREREKQQREFEATEIQIRLREEQCKSEKEKLVQERQEFEAQKEAYQRDLERLREAQRAVDKEKERLEQLKKIKKTNAGTFSPDVVQVTLLSHSSSFNGEGMLNTEGIGQLAVKPTTKSTLSMSAADYSERPEVTRRDSSCTDIRPSQKPDIPIHLLSATNQIQKQTLPTKQQIPTKLAALTKGSRDKSGRGKASHRTESLASINHRPLQSKLSAKDESLWSRTSVSPNPLTSQPVFFPQDHSGQTEPIHEPQSYSVSLQRPSSSQQLQNMYPMPPPFPPPLPPTSGEDETNKEEVIFF
uniref:Rho/Rac guanine nucleotide exchange factor 18 n=1 Tax=Leptobrachium leishanense TaxID=445787 RepID=A0A8C5M6F5_9ANUR